MSEKNKNKIKNIKILKDFVVSIKKVLGYIILFKVRILMPRFIPEFRQKKTKN